MFGSRDRLPSVNVDDTSRAERRRVRTALDPVCPRPGPALLGFARGNQLRSLKFPNVCLGDRTGRADHLSSRCGWARGRQRDTRDASPSSQERVRTASGHAGRCSASIVLGKANEVRVGRPPPPGGQVMWGDQDSHDWRGSALRTAWGSYKVTPAFTGHLPGSRVGSHGHAPGNSQGLATHLPTVHQNMM